MADRNKGYQGCKPNPDIKQKIPDTFTEFVLGFCEHQTGQRTTTCKVCGHPAVCTSAHIFHHSVFGIFTCTECETPQNRYVDMSVLKEMFDRLVEE